MAVLTEGEVVTIKGLPALLSSRRVSGWAVVYALQHQFLMI